ncbi:MAG: TonB-dependent receptor [Fermentimonas sp.]|jgi:iron complex outermembrane receptor protein
MKKVLSFFLLSAISAVVSLAVSATPDSLSHIQLEEIVVSGTRADSNTPISFSDISSSDIKKQNAARNIPVILQASPSIVSFTEDGLGVGNTQFRIRGTDATRINVTLNGMPLNNPESQEVYWVNLPDLSNSLQNIQIQRGVGTSTNGSAAFGASISLKTTGARSESYGETSTAIGSYGTFLTNIAAGSGILSNGLSFDARFSRVLGDGYINNGSIDHTNLYAALSHYTDRQLIRLSYIKGIQHTGITWEGVTADQIEEFGRRYNPAGEYYDDMGNRLYYDNETDNYYSDIVQLTLSRELSNYVSLNVGLSYNHGYGYYENYKQNKKFSEFNLPNPTIDGETYTRSDFIRQKKMKNDFYVANLGLTYNKDLLRMTFGSMYSFYDGNHYGNLPWIKHWDGDPSEIEWYRNKGKKYEFNIFTKADYQLTDMFSLFGDLQYRRVDYKFTGVDDDMADLTGDFNYNFFNPKAGLSLKFNNQSRAYASVAVGQREPLRSDLKDGIKGDKVNPIKPERMIDYELGYKYNAYNGMSFGANIYYMDYHNQMVQTGKLTDVGYKVMENVKKSYRTGIELEASIPFAENKFRFDANATFSQNKIKDYTAWFDQYDNQNDWNPAGQVSKDLGTTDISFSPDVVGAASLTWQPINAFYINLLGKYVGKQYLDNTSDDDKSIDAYFVSNLSAGYTFKKSPIGIFNLQMFVNNLFNNKYIANGYASTSVFQDGTSSNYVGYYPQATTNFMMRLSLSF